MKVSLTIFVNGEKHDLEINPNRTLLDVLREDLRLTGTKRGCGSGKCGSCTVLLDGQPVNACLVLAPQVNGKKVLTIEGLAKDKPHPLQVAFVERGAIQCGYCTPGIILAAYALLENKSDPGDMGIKSAISGNLCRCTGYHKIVEAIKSCTISQRSRIPSEPRRTPHV